MVVIWHNFSLFSPRNSVRVLFYVYIYGRLYVHVDMFEGNCDLKHDKYPLDVIISPPLKSHAHGLDDPCRKEIYHILDHFTIFICF
jgi:hypothetical protein